MNLLESKTKEICSILEGLLEALNGLNDENFDAVMALINEKMIKVSHMRLELKKSYDAETLKKYEPEVIKLTKQLSNKFDNIITRVKTEMDIIGLELNNIQNKKKLANYNR